MTQDARSSGAATGEPRQLLGAVTFAAERLLRAPLTESIDEVLEQLGRAADVTRIGVVGAVWQPDEDGPRMEVRHWWTAPGIPDLVHPESGWYAYPPRWRAALEAGETIVGDPAWLAEEEQQLLAGDQVRSIVIAPVTVDGRWYGHLSVDDTRGPRTWTPEEVDALRAAAGILGAAIQQRSAMDAIERRAGILDAVGEAASLLLDTRDWEATLPRVLELLRRATGSSHAWAYRANAAGPPGTFDLIAEAVVEGGRPMGSRAPRVTLQPPVVQRLRQGGVVSDELVATDPSRQQAALAAVDVASWVVAPVVTGQDEELGVVGLDSDHRRAWTEGEIRAIQVAAGALAAAIRHARTDREMDVATRQAMRAEKMQALASMATSAAHDFNNLLSVIVGHAQLVRTETDDAQIRADIDPILEAAGRGAELVRGMLAFGRRTEGEPAPTDLNALVEHVLRITRPMLPGAVEVARELDPARPVVVVDAAALEDALLNLMLNARDAMPGGGRVTVRTATGGAADGAALEATLLVADTGSGIQPELLDRIFMPFFSTKGEGEGAGLGLASVQRAVEASGGRVEVRSTVGTGTEFRLTLPVGAPAAAVPAQG